MTSATWEGLTVRLPPDREVKLSGFNPIGVDMFDTNKRTCTKCGIIDCDCMVTKEAYWGESFTDDPRAACVVAYLADQFHEALEWFTIDGESYAPAHGAFNDSDWIAQSLLDLIEEYKKRHVRP